MEQDTFNLFSAVLGIISLCVTIIGLYAVYIQIRKLRESTWSNTHSKLADQSFQLLTFMSNYPETYDYFYNRKSLEESADKRIIVLYIAEALANFMEHLVLQKNNLPPNQWEVWRRFIYTTFKLSVVVRQFVVDNRAWYSSDLLTIADECNVLY